MLDKYGIILALRNGVQFKSVDIFYSAADRHIHRSSLVAAADFRNDNFCIRNGDAFRVNHGLGVGIKLCLLHKSTTN